MSETTKQLAAGLRGRTSGLIPTRLLVWASGRTAWWITLALFLASWPLAALVYASGLSRWLLKPSPSASLGALAILVLFSAVFIVVSARRAADCGANPKHLFSALAVIPVPYWLVVLGLLPPSSGVVPTPYQTFNRRLKIGSLVSLAAASLVLLVGASSGTLPKWPVSSPKQSAPIASSDGISGIRALRFFFPLARALPLRSISRARGAGSSSTRN